MHFVETFKCFHVFNQDESGKCHIINSSGLSRLVGTRFICIKYFTDRLLVERIYISLKTREKREGNICTTLLVRLCDLVAQVFILSITIAKELSLCHKLWFSNPYISVTQCCRHYIFQTMNPVRLDIQSLKNQTFTLSGCTYKEIGKLKFVAKTQFLSTVK